MSKDNKYNGPDEPFDDDVDPGEPIAELAELEHPSSEGLFAKVVRAVERRKLGADGLELARVGLHEMFRSYWGMLASFFEGKSR